MKQPSTWEDYLYPGTEVLKNKPGMRDAKQLRLFEERVAGYEVAHMLSANPVEGDFDRNHMKEIHRRIFGETYIWAGEERVGPEFPQLMTKGGPSPESIARGDYTANDEFGYRYFPAGDEMTKHFDRHLRKLHSYGDLSGDSPQEFAEKLADPWGEINVAHIFREGNTRTQVVFFTYFAREHGHDLDHERFANDPAFRAKFNAGRFLIQAVKGSELFQEALSEAFSGSSAAAYSPAYGVPSDYDDYSPNYAAKPTGQTSSSSGGSPDLAPVQCGAPTQDGHPYKLGQNCHHHRGGKL